MELRAERERSRSHEQRNAVELRRCVTGADEDLLLAIAVDVGGRERGAHRLRVSRRAELGRACTGTTPDLPIVSVTVEGGARKANGRREPSISSRPSPWRSPTTRPVGRAAGRGCHAPADTARRSSTWIVPENGRACAFERDAVADVEPGSNIGPDGRQLTSPVVVFNDMPAGTVRQHEVLDGGVAPSSGSSVLTLKFTRLP